MFVTTGVYTPKPDLNAYCPMRSIELGKVRVSIEKPANAYLPIDLTELPKVIDIFSSLVISVKWNVILVSLFEVSVNSTPTHSSRVPS